MGKGLFVLLNLKFAYASTQNKENTFCKLNHEQKMLNRYIFQR